MSAAPEVRSGTAVQAALSLAEEHGLPVFPCRLHDEVINGRKYKAKSPLTKNGFKDATQNLEQIEKWWHQYPDALIGVPTGAKSGLFVVDVDPHGANWYTNNTERLSAARIHKTQRGHHLVYRDIGLGCTTGTLAEGVDTRGEGGYVVWWPAAGQSVIGDLEDIGEPPAWVVTALNPRVELKVVQAADGKLAEGGRNDALTRLAGKLRRNGLNDVELEAALLAANRQRCNPPLEDEEIRTIARSVARYKPAKESEEAALPPRSPLDWEALEDKSPAEREWAIEHWLPQRHPALLSGRGGIGKTLMAQHLGTAMVFARSYLEPISRRLKVLLWASEDDEAELWRRQIPICQRFGVRLRDLKDRLILQSYEGADITLAAPVFGNLAPTPMLAELTEQVRDYGVDYVFLDNSARIYGGNESDRHQVTTFIAWLSAACRPAGLCLLSHPAKGIGSEYSGSTAWEGAVRSRLYLSDRLPDAQGADDEDQAPDPGVRYLSRRKSNYSPNDWRRLDYQDGVLVPENVQPVAVGAIGGEFAKDIVRRTVRKLAEMGFHGNASTRSGEYLPKLANQYGLLDRLSEKRFGGIMREMIKEGDLTVAAVGKYSNRSPKMGLVLK